jgi:glycerophosphoryl diester phosphodiesterase
MLYARNGFGRFEWTRSHAAPVLMVSRMGSQNFPANCLYRSRSGGHMVSPEHQLVTAEQVRAAHDAGFDVVPWMADKPEDWGRLIAAGVDAIITDDPAALIAHLKQRKLR